MPCPHGHGAPETCSQCLGATPRKVELVGGRFVIDGQDTTSLREHAVAATGQMYAKPRGRGRNAGRKCAVCRMAGHNSATCRK